MATAKKSQPLTLEDLLSAQREMLKDPNLTEGQRKSAEQQIEKLEGIQKTLTLGNIESLKEDADINRITKVKGDAQHVSLGDVKNEISGLRKDLAQNGGLPQSGRPPLPRLRLVSNGQAADNTDAERVARLQSIGNIIGQKTEMARGGSRNEGLNARNAQTFERFIAETSKKEELLAGADEKQLEIFKRIEDTLIKLREAGSEESEALRKELAGIAGELEQSGDTTAKAKLTPMLANIRATAKSDAAGRTGNLGDVLGALTGKREVLQEGFTRDQRTGQVHHVNPETGKVGKMVKGGAAAARMGRLGGAATILGGFLGNKVEKFYEGQRSPAIQNFLDRNFRSDSRGEATAQLAGQQQALMQGATAVPQVAGSSGKATGPLESMTKASSNSLKAAVINVTGNVVNIRGGAPAAPSGDPAFSGAGTIPGVKSDSTKPAEATAEPSSGFGLGDVLDFGKRGARKAGGVLSKGAGIIRGAAPTLLKGGGVALGGAALSYGGDKLKESGYEKTGAAVDIAGQAAQWGGTGAMIGSVVPGIGTAIGAGVGAVGGAAYGLYKNWGGLFSGSKTTAGATAMPATNPSSGQVIGNASATVEASKSQQAPVVINAPSTMVAGGGGGNNNAPQQRANIRPMESAMEKYANRTSHFW